VNLRTDTEICETNFLQSLLREKIFGEDIIDTGIGAIVFDGDCEEEKDRIVRGAAFFHRADMQMTGSVFRDSQG
jgi:hypothetical protein